MRDLAKPEVLKSAAGAAAATCLLCYPRLALWQQRTFPIWYLEALVLLGTVVFWGFVFAWHTRYSGRPLVPSTTEPRLWSTATAVALFAAAALHFWIDPRFRAVAPEGYPTTIHQWAATMLFHLSFLQLFLVFAPVAWLLRLFENATAAMIGTVIFGVAVMAMNIHSSPRPLPSGLLVPWLLVAVFRQAASVYFYLRGGLLLAWWWGLIIETRLLLELNPPA